jgi:hypothetical protein
MHRGVKGRRWHNLPNPAGIRGGVGLVRVGSGKSGNVPVPPCQGRRQRLPDAERSGAIAGVVERRLSANLIMALDYRGRARCVNGLRCQMPCGDATEVPFPGV